jgi:hypothetical protein
LDGIFDYLWLNKGEQVVGGIEDFKNGILATLQKRTKGNSFQLLADGLNSDCKLVFTHSDLVPRNILVRRTKLWL